MTVRDKCSVLSYMNLDVCLWAHSWPFRQSLYLATDKVYCLLGENHTAHLVTLFDYFYPESDNLMA